MCLFFVKSPAAGCDFHLKVLRGIRLVLSIYLHHDTPQVESYSMELQLMEERCGTLQTDCVALTAAAAKHAETARVSER